MFSLKFMPPGVAGEKDVLDIELPDDEPFQSFVPDVIEAMKLPKSGPDGEIKYAFDCKELGTQIDPSKSLKEQKIQHNSTVKVRADVVAGHTTRKVTFVKLIFNYIVKPVRCWLKLTGSRFHK